MVEVGRGQLVEGGQIHGPLRFFVGAGQLAAGQTSPESRAALVGQAIGRDVIGCQT